MRKAIMICLFLAGIATNSVLAQMDIPIGTGTATNTSTTYPCPLQDRYEGSRMQYLYRASELLAAGMNAGNINGLKYQVIALSDASGSFSGTVEQFTIRVGTTSATTLGTTTWENITGTPLFGPVNYVPTVGTNVFNFVTPFFWNGTDNIVVEICNGDPNSGSGITTYTYNPLMLWTTGLSFNGSHSYRADNIGYACGTATTTNTGTQTTRPNIVFQYTPATPCTGTPDAGTVATNNANVCLGTPFTLTATGTTVASGLVYQWQRSTDNTNWTDIAGANFLTYTGVQSVTSYYRLKVTCNNSSTSSNTASVMIVSPALLGGNTYTINKAVTDPAQLYPNTLVFNNFNTAYDALKCGITGPVVFNVLANSGPYTEQLTITGAIPGASAVNTITFNGNGNTINFNTTSAKPAVIRLTGTAHFIFDNLVIKPEGPSYQFGFQLTSNADSNVLRNADIQISTTTTANTMAGIVISGSETNPIATGTTLCDYNKFERNTITGGYYGITITATANNTGACFLNEFYGNQVKDFFAYGFYATGNNGSTIDSNYFSRPSRTSVSSFNGIYFTGNSERCQISRNRIFNPFGGNPTSTLEFNGINFLNASAQSGTENFVVNNLVFDVNGNGLENGMANSSSAFVYYLHNTISLDNVTATASSPTRGFYQNAAAASVQLYNNIISISRGGNGAKYCMYATNTTSILSDYNDLYISTAAASNYVGYYLGNRKDLAAWQTASGLDLNSFSYIPLYADPSTGDYSPTNAAIDNRGYPLGIAVDIENSPRSLTTPDLGAYEFIPSGCTNPPVAGTIFISQTDVCAGVDISLSLLNNSWGLGQVFQWQMATDAAGPFTDFGTGMQIPDTSFTADMTGYFRMALTCSGGATVYSDTVFLQVNPKMPAGNYTINQYAAASYVPGVPGGNFTSFGTAVAAMNCGIDGTGNVILTVAAGSGPYDEQVIMDSIIGTSATARVIFRGNGNTLGYVSNDINQKAVIKITRSSYIVFDSLTIDASGGGTQGFGVQLVNNADFNEIRKCTILTSSTIVNTNHVGIVVNGANNVAVSNAASYCDNNLFTGNTIKGGYYGVAISGSATTAGRNEGNKFIGNTVEDFYLYGFFLGDGNYETLIEKSEISRPTRANVATGNAIYVTGTGSSVTINKNRISNLFGAATTSSAGSYGIYFNNAAATAGSEHLITNNLIYNMTGNGIVIAIQNTRSGFSNIYHNTIVIDNQDATSAAYARGFYQTGATTNIRFLNNIISITKAGLGQKHALYFETSTSGIESDYNDCYISAPGTANYFGYFSGNRATLADWQTASSQDAHSFDQDPLFTNPATHNYRPRLATIDNMGTPVGVTTDLLDAARSATKPDIGAIEFAVANCVTPAATNATANPMTNLCVGTPITLDIPGSVSYNGLKFVWQNGTSATGPWTDISDSLDLPEFNTGAYASPFYRAQIICGGTVYTSSVVTVTMNLLLQGGVYTINNSQPTNYTGTPGANFTSFADAISYMQCGITGAVVFNVAAGTNGVYDEQVTIGPIPGSSATAGVTFQAANGSASSVNLTHASTRLDSNWVVMMKGAQYITFKNLTMTATGTGYGRVYELSTDAANDTLMNCHIVGPQSNTNSPNMAAVFASRVKGTANLIKGNTIDYGSNGIYLAGTSASDLATPGNKIEDNTLNKQFTHAILLQNTLKAEVRGNTVNLSSPLISGTSGIYFNIADSGFRLMHNKVVIDSVVSGLVYGIYVNNSDASKLDSSIVASNMVEARKNNTSSSVFGITITSSKGIHVANNVIAINSSGTTAYGLYSLGANDLINYFNNSISVRSTASNGYPAYFNSSAVATQIRIRNNIFSNEGGGKAFWVNNTAYFTSDYNMLYTTGPNLVQNISNQYADLVAWKAATNWDRSSIGFKPAWVDTVTLRPDIANANSWAMQGRGVQIKGNTYDFDGMPRSDSLTGGVPDLGAYEFFPSVEPPVLTAIPATPALNQTQAFMFGTDTVMKMKWTANVPTSVAVRRYSGVVPSGLPQPREDSMFFYTKVEVPNSSNVGYDADLFYIDSWQGSIDRQSRIGLGRTTPGNAWVVGFNSKTTVSKKMISQQSLTYLDRFTGLLNTSIIAGDDADSSSNAGKNFWVGYQRTNGFVGNGQQMVLYFGAGEQEANVTVEINGTAYVRNYTVPAFTAITSELIPKAGADDARMVNEGKLDRGIHITSDVPIVAYAHIYETANSGATMLMPVGVWGYEYFTLGSRQNYSSASYAAFHVVAQHDSTWVEITPSKNTLGGWVAGQTYLVKLNKGETYQVLGAIISGSEGEDLTGSIIRSVPNNQGECFSIAAFAGSTRTAIACGTNASGSGDLIIQQIFPSQAWGTKYTLAATTNATGPSASSNTINKYRVLVKDANTVVKRNGVAIPQASLINSRYYEFETANPDYLESDKPVLVAEYMISSSACANASGDGDPEMFYLSPLQQAVKHTYFYRNITQAINTNYITLVVPTEGLATLQIDGILYSSYPASEIYTYPHSLAGYTVVTKKWGKVAGASSVECESPFTGIVYGIGSVESYGYNLGTLVKNLNATSAIQNQYNSSGNNIEYTCINSPFYAKALLDLHPDSIYWHFSALPGLTPNADSISRFPVAVDTTVVDGVTFYSFQVNQTFTMSTPGIYAIPYDYWHSSIEGCDKKRSSTIYLQVLPEHKTDFSISLSGGRLEACEGETATFTGDDITLNGLTLTNWNWTINNGTANPITASGRIQSNIPYNVAGTYSVKLNSITADGCLSDTSKQIIVKPKPTVSTAPTLDVCPGETPTLTINNPVAGTTYYWYTVATGGTPIDSGTSITVVNPAIGATYYAEAVSNACISATRSQTVIQQLALLATPTVSVTNTTTNSVSFGWTAVTGASGYQVIATVNGIAAAPVTVPATTLTYTVSNLTPATTVTLSVKAVATRDCQTSAEGTAAGATFIDQIYIPNAFTPNGDGLNDRLYVYSYVISSMQMAIFNQWGEKVFESTNMICTNNASCPGSGWDGRFKGKDLPMGVYMYVAKFTLQNGTTVERKGAINLVR